MAEAGIKVVISNRRARRDFTIGETYEAGLVLRGSEVKTLRDGKGNITDGYASIESGEAWLHGMHLPPYGQASTHETVDPDRRRKLLLHSAEIERLRVATQQKGLTIVPLKVYFKDGRIKVELGVGVGRRSFDKRNAIAERDVQREVDRELKRSRQS